ncbi:MAG: protein kinase domain-containing protein, partial [Planctomycetaceae bacterium]
MSEAEITGRLEHPGIVPVYSLGHHADGRPYYAMWLIAGEQAGTLQQALRQFHAAPPTDPAERDLQWRGLLRRVIDVCNTMAYAHSQGVLHRDLKPANILLGPYGETLVVDWGLAREFRSQSSSSSHRAPPAHLPGSAAETPRPNSAGSLTPTPDSTSAAGSLVERSAGVEGPAPSGPSVLSAPSAASSADRGESPANPLSSLERRAPLPGSDSGPSGHGPAQVPEDRASAFPGQAVSFAATRGVGTLGHAAPEQLLGEPDCLRPTSDIYALGTLLYAVLTGVSPFSSRRVTDPAALLHQICHGEFPPPRRLCPMVERGLEAICLKAMARQPADRYPSATALAADLERHLAGEAVSAWREPWLVRLRRGLLRHRTLVTTLAVALLLTTFAASAVAVLQTRNRRVLAEEAAKLDEALLRAQAEQRLANQEWERAEREQRLALEARAQAEAERERAVAGEALAVQAVDEFRQAVLGHPELTRSAELLTLRKELLSQPLEFYRQLRERLLALPEPSLETLWKLRDATSQLAVLQAQVGDPTEAIGLHESVLELADRALASPGAK